jgi:chromosome segregation ATPase
MPVTAPAPLPLAIDRVERSRAKHDQVRLRLSGHWLDSDAGREERLTEALLVVQMHGRRHRFAVSGEDEQGDSGNAFVASFTIPDWAVPEQPGQAVLWVGEGLVPVPPPGSATPGRERALPAATAEPRAADAPTAKPGRLSENPADGTEIVLEGSGAGRAGPLSELLYKETVTALHAELEQRGGEAARLRAELAEARQAGSRGAGAADLEGAHAELRAEMRRLMEAVGEQRQEFDAALTSARGERDRAREELDTIRAELESARADLQEAHRQLEGGRGDLEGVRGERDAVRAELEQARTELEEARSQLAQTQAELEAARTRSEDAAGELAAARAEFDQQLAAVRAEGEAALEAARLEAEAELIASRQETEAMLAAVRGETDDRLTAAEAEARELAARLRERTAGERRRAEEAAILREQLAAAHVARDAATSEIGGLRAELERLGGELAVLREQGGEAAGGLSEARQLLADARALTERLRGDSPG